MTDLEIIEKAKLIFERHQDERKYNYGEQRIYYVKDSLCGKPVRMLITVKGVKFETVLKRYNYANGLQLLEYGEMPPEFYELLNPPIREPGVYIPQPTHVLVEMFGEYTSVLFEAVINNDPWIDVDKDTKVYQCQLNEGFFER